MALEDRLRIVEAFHHDDNRARIVYGDCIVVAIIPSEMAMALARRMVDVFNEQAELRESQRCRR